jgi:hypothetical protein
MSTNQTPISISGVSGTLANILKALASVNGYVQLGMVVGETLIPLGKALISEFKSVISGPTETYTVVLTLEESELDKIISGTVDGVAAINAELARQGAQLVILPPQPVAPTPTPAAPAPDAPAK